MSDATETYRHTHGQVMTVGELVALLSRYDPGLKVGFRAGCCGYSHCLHAVRAADPDDGGEDRHDLVIEVDG